MIISMDWLKAPSLIFRLSGKCNQRCIFCLQEEKFTGVSTEEAKKQLEQCVRDGHYGSVDFMYNETLCHEGFPDVLETCGRLGLIAGVATNGLKLADDKYFTDLLNKGLKFLEVSIHASDQDKASAISGVKTTFQRQKQALKNIAAHIDDLLVVTFNIVICAINRETIGNTVEYIESFFDPAVFSKLMFHLKFVNLIGRAALDQKVACRYSDVELGDVLAHLTADKITCLVENVPLCRLRGFEHLSQFAFDRVLRKKYHYMGYENKSAPIALPIERNCPLPAPPGGGLRCPLIPLCQGPEKDYVRMFGAGEFAPPEISAVLIARRILSMFS